MRSFFRVSGLLCALLFVNASAAQDARTLFAQGQTAYQQGDYELSLEKWNAAYQLDPKPLIQYNLAQSYERLGRLVDAEKALDLYLRDAAADDVYQADARSKRDNIRRRLASTGIKIMGAPGGASIMVNETAWGLTPRPDMIRVAPGTHQVRLKKDGYEVFKAAVVVPPGQTIVVKASMITQKTTTPASLAAQTAEPSAADEGGAFPVLEAVLVGAGGALAATGLIVGLTAVAAAGDEVEGTDDADAIETQALVGDIVFVAGAALATTGVLMLLLDGDEESEVGSAGHVWVAPHASPYGGGIAGGVSF